jgi:hypothetical protein
MVYSEKYRLFSKVGDGICGLVVKAVDFKPLTLTAFGSNPAMGFGFFHVRMIIWLAYRMSVFLLRCTSVHYFRLIELAPEASLHL